MGASTAQVFVNCPGDGQWVMTRVGGVFNDKTDHVVSLHRGGKTCGGVVFTGYLQASIVMHMAGNETNWATREFLWAVFHYVFVQLGCRKAIGLVPSDNHRAISVDLRLGFRVETRITDATVNGADLLILTMTRDMCKWLRFKPEQFQVREDEPQPDVQWGLDLRGGS